MAFFESFDQKGIKREFDHDMATENMDSPSGLKYRRGLTGALRDEIEIRILVPSKSAGAIIGKGGNTIKRLREQYKAHVNVPDSQGPERVLSLQASEENLGNLMSEVFQCLVDDSQRNSERGGSGGRRGGGPGEMDGVGEGMCDVRLLIHQSQAGAVIGRQGTKVKELRETSGLKNVKVFTDPCPNSTDRVVQLIGEPLKVSQTVMTILQILKDAPPKGPVQVYNPASSGVQDMGYGGWSGGGGGGGGMMAPGGPAGPGMGFPGGGLEGGFGGGARTGGRGGFPTAGGRGGFGMAPGGEITSTQVSIPDRLTGAIMGRGGSRIKQIRVDSGAEIKIDAPAAGQEDRIITIRGSQEQIQTAQYLLQMCVKKYGNL